MKNMYTMGDSIFLQVYVLHLASLGQDIQTILYIGSKVLLNSKFDAKIADFGLVKMCPDDNKNFTTNLVGTM